MLRLYFNCAAFGFMIISAFADLSGMQLTINIAFIVAGDYQHPVPLGLCFEDNDP